MTTESLLYKTLIYTYNLDEPLIIALEAFLRKTFSEGNLAKFSANPLTMYNLLDQVVYDDLGGFSYTFDWEVVAEDYSPLFVNRDGRESTKLVYIRDNTEVDYKDLV